MADTTFVSKSPPAISTAWLQDLNDLFYKGTKALTVTTLTATTVTATNISAFTLGGTISGGGNQINNVIIGTSTPLAGAFTTIAASGTITSTKDGTILARTGATTSAQVALDVANTGGRVILGVADSAGGATILSGGTAYATQLTSIGATALEFGVNGALVGKFNTSGAFFVGDTTNAKLTLGLTINQGAADDEIVALKSSDVAHGVTDITETDTFGMFRKFSGTVGGLEVIGLTEADVGLNLLAIHTTEDATKSIAGTGNVQISGYLKSGTATAAQGANSNVLAVKTNGTTRFILDSDGDSHQDVGTAWTNFDAHDDIALMNSIAVAIARRGDPLRQQFNDSLATHRAQIEGLPGKPIVTFNKDGHHFVNNSRLVMLHHGAIRQLAQRVAMLEAVR